MDPLSIVVGMIFGVLCLMLWASLSDEVERDQAAPSDERIRRAMR